MEATEETGVPGAKDSSPLAPASLPIGVACLPAPHNGPTRPASRNPRPASGVRCNHPSDAARFGGGTIADNVEDPHVREHKELPIGDFVRKGALVSRQTGVHIVVMADFRAIHPWEFWPDAPPHLPCGFSDLG